MRAHFDVFKQRAKRILIVDDERDIREILSILLSTKGFEVVTAENGKTAFETLLNTPCDLLITDLNMPIMDGLELVDKIFMNDMKINTILMSTFVPEMSKEYTKRRRIHGYVEKPFHPEEMIAAVETGLMEN